MDFTEDDNYMVMFSTVCKFLNLSYIEANNLPCDLFMLSYRNAIIERMMQTEEDKAKLKKYNRLKQTTPDIDKLREKYGGEK